MFSVELSAPTEKYELAGFSPRQSGVCQIGESALFVKILWLKSGDSSFIFISVDALYFPKSISQPVVEFLQEHYGIDPGAVIFSATHTHSAPSIALRNFGAVSHEFISQITRKIFYGLEFCQDRFVESRLYFQRIDIGREKIVSRRRVGRDIRSFFLKKKVLRLPNEEMVIDEYLRLICIKDVDGQVIGMIVNLSCHPVFSAGQNISSDYPGQMGSDLAELSGGFFMFLQGYCGDVRPNYQLKRFAVGDLVGSVKRIFNKSVFKKLGVEDFRDFCGYFDRKIRAANMMEVDAIQRENLDFHSFTAVIQSSTGITKKSVDVKLISLDRLMFISIPAEVSSRYFVALSEVFPDLSIVPVGNTDGMIGYLPLPEEISEGGYEVSCSGNYEWDSVLSIRSVKEFYDLLVQNVAILLARKN